MNTGQTVYEQLQEIADAFAQYKGYAWINIEEDRIEMQSGGGYETITISYHDFFSIESGIMEYVEWYDTLDGFEPNAIPHYNSMSMLTAEEKYNYFVRNAIIPTKKQQL